MDILAVLATGCLQALFVPFKLPDAIAIIYAAIIASALTHSMLAWSNARVGQFLWGPQSILHDSLENRFGLYPFSL